MLHSPYILRNDVINGDFIFDQLNENAAVTPAATTYICDMWKLVTTGLGSDITAQVINSASPFKNFPNALKLLTASSATPTAAQFTSVSHFIEGISIADYAWGTNDAKNVYLTFEVQANFTGTLYVSVRNSALNRSYVYSYTIPFQPLPYRPQIIIPGDTSGTWLTGEGQIGANITFDLGAGSNFNTTAGAWQAGNFMNAASSTQLVSNGSGILYIGNVEMRPISFPSTSPIPVFPYVPRPFATEKALVQRFYEKTFEPGTAPVQNSGLTVGAITAQSIIAASYATATWHFKVPKAKIPTITTYNPGAANASWRNITDGADVAVTVDPGGALDRAKVFLTTGTTVTNINKALLIHVVGDSRL